MPRRLRLTVTIVVVSLLGAFAINSTRALRLFYRRASAAVDELPSAAPFQPGQRVLVFAPHPDDESLGCAGTIQHAQEAGADVWVAWLTSGDGFGINAALLRRTRPSRQHMLELGRRRMLEADRAVAVLNIPPDHLFFLGYPDRGLLRLFLSEGERLTSRYTGADRVPYKRALRPGAPYTAPDLERDLEQVLNVVRPDVVLGPCAEDRHPDHRGASHFITRLLGRRGEADKLRVYMVHGGLEYPLPKGLHDGLPLLIPPRGRKLAWQRVDLSEAQITRKLEAVRAHATQMAVLGRFMLAFVRENELLSRPGAADEA